MSRVGEEGVGTTAAIPSGWCVLQEQLSRSRAGDETHEGGILGVEKAAVEVRVTELRTEESWQSRQLFQAVNTDRNREKQVALLQSTWRWRLN